MLPALHFRRSIAHLSSSPKWIFYWYIFNTSRSSLMGYCILSVYQFSKSLLFAISFFLRDEARGFVKCDNYGSPLHDYWKPFNNISTFEKNFHVSITCRGNKFNLNLLFPQLLYKYAYIKLSIHNTFSFTSEDRRATTNENCKKSVTLWTQQEAASTHAQNGKATAKQSTWTAKWACAVVFADVRQQACLPHATTRNCTQLFLLLVDLVVN